MKRLAFVVPVLAVSAASASAADLAPRPYTKALPPVVAAYSWSGFYVGLNGGGGSAHNCWAITNNAGAIVSPPVAEGCNDATGGTVGGQVGYRWQAASWLFGVEAQGNWANFTGSNNNLSAPGLVGDRTKVDAFGLFTGEVGYAVNNVLFYVKGGGAATSDKYNNFALVAIPPVAAGQNFSAGSETRWGGVAGVGVEFGFAPNWSVGLEYDHMFMGTRSVTLNALPPLAPGLFITNTISQDVDVGTVRVNYRFGGPVVARY